MKGCKKLSLLFFLLLQILDGALTYWGVHHYGHTIEGNPLIKNLIINLGPLLALLSVKLLACYMIIKIFKQKFNKMLSSIVGIVILFYTFAIFLWILMLLKHYLGIDINILENL